MLNTELLTWNIIVLLLNKRNMHVLGGWYTLCVCKCIFLSQKFLTGFYIRIKWKFTSAQIPRLQSRTAGSLFSRENFIMLKVIVLSISGKIYFAWFFLTKMFINSKWMLRKIKWLRHIKGNYSALDKLIHQLGTVTFYSSWQCGL